MPRCVNSNCFSIMVLIFCNNIVGLDMYSPFFSAFFNHVVYSYICSAWLTVSLCFLSGKVGARDHQRFQASYATILKAHMTALKKRERKDKKKAAEGDKKEGDVKKKPKRV